MIYDSPVAPLLAGAAQGMDTAWREIVDRYSPLVSAVCHRHRISGADADDVTGAVWLQLVANLARIREPEALPGWIVTTTKHECLTLLRHRKRNVLTDSVRLDATVETDFDAGLIATEREDAARAAFARLPERDQHLLSMLFGDQPLSYKEISAVLGIPIGAIGPTRARCLKRARRTPAIAALAHHPSTPSHDPQGRSAAA